MDRPETLETTALGAAYLAGLAIGWYADLDEIARLWHCERTFEPQMAEEERETLYAGWQDAVNRVKCR